MEHATAAAGHAAHGEHEMSFVRRYIFSLDHKVIGIQYMLLGLMMGVIGSLLSYIFRWQLAFPETSVPGYGFVGPDDYTRLTSMHGGIMVLFVAMPLVISAFGNYVVPIMVGADDMAFPHLNMMSVWTFLVGCILVIASFFVPGGGPASGWVMYPPLSAVQSYTGVYYGFDLFLLGIAFEFASFLMGGVNIVVTSLNMRAPGMSLMRMPILVWGEVIASVLFLLSVGPLIAAALMLLLDRNFGTGFFLPDKGGDPMLWQHLFWFFGHPEVYVIAVPGLCIMLEVVSVFARKPVFGYKTIIYAICAAGALSFIVWAHHMFMSGLDPRAAEAFSISTIMISVPFAVMIFCFVATLWGGSIEWTTPMLFAVGTLFTFVIGGVTGIHLGTHATDIYMHGGYFVVAHFHYTLAATAVLGTFTGIYFWYPKMFGRMLNETLGQVHFVMTFAGFYLLMIPMFLLGLAGGPRRYYEMTQFDYLKPYQYLHVIASIGAFIAISGQIPFFANFFYSLARGRIAGRNPWRANTLEWTVDSPPPHANFQGRIPHVYHDPYEYSVPGMTEDYLPQDQPGPAAAVTAAGR